MPKYAIAVTAKITKVLNVQAANESAARDLAYQHFTAELEFGKDERYQEEIEWVKPLSADTPCEIPDEE